MSTEPPERIAWAVRLLAPAAGEHVLEIGCGRGVAVGLLAAAGARVTALDRSATAIAASRARNAALEKAGEASFLCADFSSAALPAHAFDAILAINVNLFWLQPAALMGLTPRLATGGRIVLAYDPPGEAQLSRIAESLADGMAAAGLACEIVRNGGLLGAAARAA